VTANVSAESIASPCPIASLFAPVPETGEREQISETSDPVREALRLFADFYEHAHPAPRWLGSENPQLAPPTCECPIVRFPLSRGFQFARYDEPGVVLAVVHVVTASDAETSIGLAAWCPDRPEQIYRYPADLPCLGLDQLDNPASYFAGKALPVHRTARAWLLAGCHGIVPLDTDVLWEVLRSPPDWNDGYRLLVEDIDHGRELRDHLLCPLPPSVQLRVRPS
jgi:hypothetical protein